MQVASEIGFVIPKSTISNNKISINNITAQCSNDCIIKPIKSGNMNNDKATQVIFTSRFNLCPDQISERIEAFPMYIQKNIHKSFDLRCIVVGEFIFCAQIDSQIDSDSIIDWRKSKKYLKHTAHNLPIAISNKCVEMTKKLGLNYSAIDLIQDIEGNYVFLECNPNGQWAWLENRLGFPISTKIVELLKDGCNN